MTVSNTTILTVSDFNAATDQFAATVDKNLGKMFGYTAASDRGSSRDYAPPHRTRRGSARRVTSQRFSPRVR